MTDNFPLFRLPYVALYEVLDHVGPAPILSLSLCSKRVRFIVRNYHGPLKKVNIEFDIAECALKVYRTTLISVNIVSEISTHFERVTIGAHRVPVEVENGILKTYWNDEKEGMEAITKYTLDVFNGKLRSLISHGALSDAAVRFWIEWIKKFQKKIYRLSIWWLSTDHPDQLTKYILESDFVTGDLQLQLPTSLDGWRIVPDPRSYSMDFLYLRPSNWVTLDHFLTMDIKSIYLRKTHLTCQDVNVFLKRWINGECSKRIKEVSLDMGIEFDVLFNDIEVTRRDFNVKRRYVGYRRIEVIVGGFDIRRKSHGAMATIMNKHGELEILFWPDYKGNPYH